MPGRFAGIDEELRESARNRIKARRGFWNLLLVLVIVAIIINVVWWFSGAEYYWPAWPMLGFVIAILFTALNAFGPGNRPISEEEVDREVRRLKGE